MFHRPSTPLAWLLAGVMFCSPLWAVELGAPLQATAAPPAQQLADTTPIAAQAAPIEMSYVPDSAFLGVLFQPARVLGSEEFESAPIEVLQALGVEEYGIDPLDISQVLVVAMMMEGDQSGPVPTPAAVLRFSQAYSLEDTLAARQPTWNQEDLNGGLLLRQDNWEETCYFMPDDTTLLIGDENAISLLLSQDAAPDSKLVEVLSAAGKEHDALAVLDLEPLRPLLEMAREEGLPPGVPAPWARLTEVPDLLSYAQATVNLTGDRASSLELVATDADAAEQLETILASALSFTAEFITTMQEESAGDTEDPIQQATLAYTQRALGVLVESFQPERDGDRLTLSYQPLPGDQKALVNSLCTMAALATPAIFAAREAARRNMAMNHMRQIGLALMNHAAVTGDLPVAGGPEDDRPGLSWRVHMLPYLEENHLYQQFHLDEPWDSEHNMALIEQMPAVYANPSQPGEPGHTHYQLVVGEGTAFNGESTSLSSFDDGTSMTAILVEADTPVIWTKPDDWEFDAQDPLQGLGNLRGNGSFYVMFADTSVHFLSAAMSPETMHALVTPAGHESLNYEDIYPDSP